MTMRTKLRINILICGAFLICIAATLGFRKKSEPTDPVIEIMTAKKSIELTWETPSEWYGQKDTLSAVLDRAESLLARAQPCKDTSQIWDLIAPGQPLTVLLGESHTASLQSRALALALIRRSVKLKTEVWEECCRVEYDDNTVDYPGLLSSELSSKDYTHDKVTFVPVSNGSTYNEKCIAMLKKSLPQSLILYAGNSHFFRHSLWPDGLPEWHSEEFSIPKRLHALGRHPLIVQTFSHESWVSRVDEHASLALLADFQSGNLGIKQARLNATEALKRSGHIERKLKLTGNLATKEGEEHWVVILTDNQKIHQSPRLLEILHRVLSDPYVATAIGSDGILRYGYRKTLNVRTTIRKSGKVEREQGECLRVFGIYKPFPGHKKLRLTQIVHASEIDQSVVILDEPKDDDMPTEVISLPKG
ncbi:hypothetical protein BVX97_05590 [bacterium E08(2017)]|nr:hypothetical protein BVX97_05590 [bacterium E08(2017)]